MRIKRRKLALGGTALLITMVVTAVVWRRDGSLPVRAVSVAPDSQPSAAPRSPRYVGAYTIPLTTTDNAAASGSEHVSEVLTSTASSTAKAQALLAMFPQLSATAQTAAAHHIVNLLPDDSYPSFAPHLTNVNASAEVRAIIYADLLQRPNAIKLPWLLVIARSPEVSQAGEAALLLQATLREDHGTNWSVWSERVSAWLQANPDAAAAKASN